MLRKDDAFEVVFNPGTDKVEKLCLGPVPATCGNTGCWSLITAAQPGIHTAAERYDFSGLRSIGQSSSALGRGARAHRFGGFTFRKRVPVGKGLRSGDADLRRDHNA